jgi:IS4 transposase
MHEGQYIFSQITEIIPWYEFDKYVKKYDGNSKVRTLSCHDQFLAMIFGQLADRKSLRDIVNCLQAHSNKLYHLGFKNPPILPTLAKANENRDWRIYRDFTQVLIGIARNFYVDDNDFDIELEGTPYVLDSTIIELSLGLFKWAKFEFTKSAVKVHTLLDLKGNIPSFFQITTGLVHDVNMLDRLIFKEGAYYIMDRGYFDFKRLYTINLKKAFFIVRAKGSLSFDRIYSNKIDKANGLRCDQIIKPHRFYARKDYPENLRRVKYYDEVTDKSYVYLTNNFIQEAFVIAKLYKYRWQIELFFKWVKQHLHITAFYGRSRNAVKTQICVSICAFLLVCILKKRLKIDRNIYEILQILQVSLFVKEPINTLLSEFDLQTLNGLSLERPSLFDS